MEEGEKEEEERRILLRRHKEIFLFFSLGDAKGRTAGCSLLLQLCGSDFFGRGNSLRQSSLIKKQKRERERRRITPIPTYSSSSSHLPTR